MQFINILKLILILTFLTEINSFCVIRKSSLYDENECLLSSDKITENQLTELCVLRANNFNANKTINLHTIKDGVIVINKTIDDLCGVGFNERLTFIPWSVVENRTLAEVIMPGKTYFFGRFYSNTTNGHVYCLTDAVAKNCVTNDNQNITGNFDILIEKLAIRYDLHDIINEPWRNTTELNTTTLAHTVLANEENRSTYKESVIEFTSEKTSIFDLPKSITVGVPLYIYKNKELQYDLSIDRSRTENEPKKLKTIHVLGPASELNVSVLGTWITSLSVFNASLITTYDNYDKQLSIFKAHLVETYVTKLHVVDDGPTDVTVEVPISDPEVTIISTESPVTTPSKLPTTSAPIEEATRPPVPVYPGFKQYAIIGGIIFFSAVLIAAIDVSRKIIRNKRNKRKKNALIKN